MLYRLTMQIEIKEGSDPFYQPDSFKKILYYSSRRNIDRPNIDRFWDFSRIFFKINFYLLNKI